MTMYQADIIPFDMQDIVDQELNDGEQLLWSSQPSVSRAVIKSLPLVVFALIWIAIPSAIAFGMYNEYQQGKEVPAMAFVMVSVFLVIGLLMLSPSFWAARKAKKTVYAITNNRAIMIKKGFSIDIQSFGPDKLRDIIKRLRSNGSGDLVFERTVSYHRNSKGRMREKVKEIGFFGIERVNEVEDMLMAIA